MKCFTALILASLPVFALIASCGAPLGEAAIRGDAAFIKNYKCDVNVSEASYGMPALVLAARAGHKEAVKALLEAGANVNSRDSEGNTALITAVFYGRTDVVETLLAAGADTNAISTMIYDIKEGSQYYYGPMTALDIAMKKNFTAIVKLLKQGK